jgi:hypothetical protein
MAHARLYACAGVRALCGALRRGAGRVRGQAPRRGRDARSHPFPLLPCLLPSPPAQAALTFNSADGRWHAHAVSRHLGGGAACKPGVYWGRVALPADGELAGRASLSASDAVWHEEAGLAYPSVAVAANGVAWVGCVFSSVTQPLGEPGAAGAAGTEAHGAPRSRGGTGFQPEKEAERSAPRPLCRRRADAAPNAHVRGPSLRPAPQASASRACWAAPTRSSRASTSPARAPARYRRPTARRRRCRGARTRLLTSSTTPSCWRDLMRQSHGRPGGRRRARGRGRGGATGRPQGPPLPGRGARRAARRTQPLYPIRDACRRPPRLRLDPARTPPPNAPGSRALTTPRWQTARPPSRPRRCSKARTPTDGRRRPRAPPQHLLAPGGGALV